MEQNLSASQSGGAVASTSNPQNIGASSLSGASTTPIQPSSVNQAINDSSSTQAIPLNSTPVDVVNTQSGTTAAGSANISPKKSHASMFGIILIAVLVAGAIIITYVIRRSSKTTTYSEY